MANIYEDMLISPLNLLLDYKNPRFIVPPGASQEMIRLYLLNFEEVSSLANDIVEFGGLMPGERIIICKENDSYIVLEGNRRVCACQLLLNPELIPQNYKYLFPRATNEVLENISMIEADLVPSRISAQNILAERHIEGIKKWSTISKYKFYANSFENGKTVDEISQIIGINRGKIQKGIREYNLLRYALELPYWSEDDKKHLDLHEIKVTPFLRIFSGKGKSGQNGRSLLKIRFDDKTLQPQSSLPEDKFNKAIYLIAKSVFINTDSKNKIDTRNSIDDVPGLMELLNDGGDASADNIIGKQLVINPTDDDTRNIPNKQHISTIISPSVPRTQNINITQESQKELQQTLSGSISPKPQRFFENLSWSGVDAKKPENQGVIACADEIRKLSQSGHYSKYPISTAMLLRALLEHTLKYYAKKHNFWAEIANKGKDPELSYIIKIYKSKVNSGNLFDKSKRELFKCIFSGDLPLNEYLNIIIHRTENVRATKEILESIANGGLFNFINYLLNE